MRKRFFIITLMAMTICVMSASALAVPGVINFQGKLTNADGVSLDGTYTITFSLYNVENGGEPIWSESQSVTVADGIYNVQLGTENSLSASLFDNDNLYLKVEVENETLAPRQRITCTAYAMKAEIAGDADTVDGQHASDFLGTEDDYGRSGVAEDLYEGGTTLTNKYVNEGQPNSITHSMIATDAITGNKIADGTVGPSDLSNNAVTTDKIQDGTIQQAKLSFSVPDGHSLDAADGNPVNALYVDNAGNIGVGTTSPTRQLHIHAGDFSNYIRLSNTNTGQTEQDGFYLGINTGGTVFLINKEETSMAFQTAAQTRLVITKEGNVGIGTGIATARVNSMSSGNVPNFLASGGVADFAVPAGQNMQIGHWDGDTGTFEERIRISSGGNVGIGTDSPTENLTVRGNILLLSESTGSHVLELGEGLDYSEGFNVSDEARIEPGTILIIDPNNPGELTISNKPYDPKVAGIVAGANGLGSGVRLGAGQFDYDVALAGRVYCKVDATKSGVEPGDLLTTSASPGYAMKYHNYSGARGTILGKAMERLEKGQKSKILVLVTLQ